MIRFAPSFQPSMEGPSLATPSPSTSKIQTNGILKATPRKLDLEPPRLEPIANEEPGCSGYSNSVSNNAKARDELSNGKEVGVETPSKSAMLPSAASKPVSPSPASDATGASKKNTDEDDDDDDEEIDRSEPHKEGTARSKSYSLLVDSNGNSHRKHREKNGKKSIFTNLGSKLISQKNSPQDQTEIHKSLVPYESSDDEEDEVDEIVTNSK